MIQCSVDKEMCIYNFYSSFQGSLIGYGSRRQVANFRRRQNAVVKAQILHLPHEMIGVVSRAIIRIAIDPDSGIGRARVIDDVEIAVRRGRALDTIDITTSI